ncbi:DNA repair protein RecO [Miniphocaeibacter massiliensis]|uniref:DNA repair protein RecO n=1 Tax=Miniphocaeibacter massiliensis TaxID=2041841 RepID=UPI000C085165|nr:DNA repair protein RecO [Miniphocaeibacter massiliensis]
MVINRDKVESKAIVLNSFNIKENSRILKIFSYEYGRMDLILQGIKKIDNEKIYLDIFSEIIVSMAIYKNYSYLLEYELVKTNYKIRKNNDNIIFGNLILEIIQNIFPLNYPDKKIYNLTEKYFEEISIQEANSYILTVAYILKFLAYTGYKLDLSVCAICGEDKVENYYYSPIDADIVCSKHINRTSKYKLELKKVVLLNKLLYSRLEDIKYINYKDDYFLLMLVIETIENLFDTKKLNSHKFISNIQRGIYE